MFSSRGSFDLSPNRLTVALARARRDGIAILDLTESNPARAEIAYDESEIVRAIGSPKSLRYEPAAFGLESAREAVARSVSAHGPAVDAGRIVLTASTSEAYAFLFKLLVDPGGEVLVPRPSYPLFEHLARLECVGATPYRLAYDGAWHVDMASVRAAVSSRTRAIVVVAPNNPTGSFLRRDELDALVAFGFPIVSDEVFAHYPLREDESRAHSVLEAKNASLVFSLGGLSKLAALPQMKLAWIAVGGHGALVDASLSRLEVIADAFLSVGTVVQHAAPALLASSGTARQAIRARTRSNVDFVRTAVAQSALSVLDVEAGWYATLRLPRTRSEEDWALAFVEQDRVHVHPGHFFDFEEEAYVIVSLLTPEATFREGIRRLVDRVAHG